MGYRTGTMVAKEAVKEPFLVIMEMISMGKNHLKLQKILKRSCTPAEMPCGI